MTNWNPFPVVVATPTLLLIGAAILTGERWWWAAFVAVGSVAAQAHLLGALLTAAIGVGVLVIGLRRRLLICPKLGEVALSLALLIACWWAPALDVITRHPNNFDQIRNYLGGERTAEAATISWLSIVIYLALIMVLIRSRKLRQFGPLVDLVIWSLAVLVLILVVFPSRQLYLVMALGVPILSVSMLSHSFLKRFYARTWRNVALAALAAMVLFAPTTSGGDKTLYAASAKVIGQVNSALADVDRQESVFVEGTGVMAAGGVGPSVQAALVADGWFAARNEFTADPDQAFRDEVRDGPYIFVTIRNLAEDATTPTVPEGFELLNRATVSHGHSGGGELEIQVFRVN
ncbi:MAG TPA: hypothetical protein PLQ19_00050 [Aeromicrobium sp.]|nr:hypothetical protein [Aeromicrobium sp.]